VYYFKDFASVSLYRPKIEYALTAGAGMIVYVIAQDPAVRRALHSQLSPAGLMVWPFAHAQDFLDQLADLQPAPIMTDLGMPKIGGLAVLAALSKVGIHWPVIMMTVTADTPLTVEAMQCGAIEVLEHPLRADLLTAALDRAFTGLRTTADKSRQRQAAKAQIALLTGRERSVIRGLIEGKTNQAIATALAISPRTVEGHRAHALQKLNVRSIAEIVHLAVDGDLDLRPRPIELS
jgi:FixJ family two-component response regulator